MNYKKTTSLLFMLIITSHFFSQGLKINDTIDYNKNIKTAKLTSSRSIILENRYTLEKFLPYVHYQSGSECLAYALSTCRTICYARDNKYDNINKISFESFSPHYSYISFKRLKNDTIEKSMTRDFKGINELGFCKLKLFEFPNYYPFSNKHITGFPSLVFLKDEALKYKFSSFTKINLRDNNKATLIKEFLIKQIPAVACFNPWPTNLETNSKTWFSSLKKFKEKEQKIGHAVTLIGYDDNKYGGSFLIYNSWGEDFGNNGKMWIPYKEFFKYIDEVFFTLTSEVKDYSNYNIQSKQGTNIISTNYDSNNTVLSFNWTIRMPILNKLGIYKGDISIDGKRNGNGEFKADNLATYKGKWKDDVPYGNGQAELNEDLKYKANWKNEFELPEIYESEFSEIVNYNGVEMESYYIGGFKDTLSSGIFHGNGVLKYGGNIVYEGEWLNGEKNGNGISYYNGKKNYEGEWLNGEKNGNGILYGPNWKYVGEFLNNQRNGKGTTYREDGSIYQNGIFKNNKFVK